MTFLDLISYKHLTCYQITLTTKLSKTTLYDISVGNSSLMNCNGKTLLELSKVLGVSIETLLHLEDEENKILLPEFLNESIYKLRKAIRTNSTLLDCCYDELASSINVAETESCISKETANRLRKRYLNVSPYYCDKNLFHSVKNVIPIKNFILIVNFTEGITKKYDVKPLFKKFVKFNNLKDNDLFNEVFVGPGGYGVIFNSEIDISCNELFNNGKIV